MKEQPSARRGALWGALTCAACALAAVAASVAAVAIDEPAFALVAAAAGVVAGVVGVVLDVRRTRAEQAVLEGRAQNRGLRRQLQAFELQAAAPCATGEPTDDWAIDPTSGLIRDRHLPVVLQQVLASARRKVQPVSVVVWELDGLGEAPGTARDQALTALAAVAWRTMRDSDAMFQWRDDAAVGVLVDTAEPGALVVADRVRASLRTSPVGDSLTVSAGIACYPTHALDPVELVSRAGKALEAARADGYTRDHVTVADQFA